MHFIWMGSTFLAMIKLHDPLDWAENSLPAIVKDKTGITVYCEIY